MIYRAAAFAGDTLKVLFRLTDKVGKPITLDRIVDGTSTFGVYYFNSGAQTYVIQNQAPIADMAGILRNAETISSISGYVRPTIVLPNEHNLPFATHPVFITESGNPYLDDQWVPAKAVGPKTLRLQAQVPSTVTTMKIATGVMAIEIAAANVAIHGTTDILRQNQTAELNLTYDSTLEKVFSEPYEVLRAA